MCVKHEMGGDLNAVETFLKVTTPGIRNWLKLLNFLIPFNLFRAIMAAPISLCLLNLFARGPSVVDVSRDGRIISKGRLVILGLRKKPFFSCNF